VKTSDEILGEQALTEEELSDLTAMVLGLADPTFLRNQADGKDVVLSAEDREGLRRLAREIPAERKSRSEAWEAAEARALEILKLRRLLSYAARYVVTVGVYDQDKQRLIAEIEAAGVKISDIPYGNKGAP
jgi:hypothetical protein